MRRQLALVAMLTVTACAAAGSAVVRPIAPLAPAGGISRETLLALTSLCSAEAANGARPNPDLKLAAGMGTGGFKVDSASKDAQDWFDYGLALSHAFYHEDAKAAMQRSVKADPQCSLCAWGEAWTLGPTLNYGIDEDGRKAALEAAQRAQKLAKPGDARAKRLADAIVARYAGKAAAVAGETNVLGGPKAGEGQTEPAFGQAMAKIAADYPDDAELAVLAAHSLLIPVRGGDEHGLKPALALLEGVLRKHPDDTGAIHYYIHGAEFDGRAEDAIAYAERLGRLAPAASHLVHMPAHTLFHAGRYEEAGVVNAQAIEADANWIRAGGNPNAPKASATDLPMYYAHNLAFGLAGSLMAGDGELALRYAEHAAKVYPDAGPARRGNPTPRTFVALALYAPDQMLNLPVSVQTDPKSKLYRAYGRGEALLRRGDAAGARRELDALRAVDTGIAEKTIAIGVLQGRLAMAEGNPAKAASLFAEAAAVQGKNDDYMDPPEWWYPVRRSVAAAWLKAGDFGKARAEATASLKVWKNDPMALWVLGKAQLGLGEAVGGEASLAKARALWRGNFDSITLEAV
jgi:tetratricopeptide (TPR) repeat protein